MPPDGDASGSPAVRRPAIDDVVTREAAANEMPIEEIDRARDELRSVARRRLGIRPDRDDETPPLRRVLRQHAVGRYPLFALGSLAIVDTFHSYAFAVLAPDISATLGISKSTIAALLAVKTVALAIAALPLAAIVQTHPRRALFTVAAAVAWSLIAISTGFVTATIGLLLVLVFDGVTTASTGVLHGPLLMDTYPPETRVRVLSLYQGANSAGNVIAPLLVGVLVAWFALTWRGVFVVVGSLSLLIALGCFGLRDPGFGRFDTERVRDAVRDRHHKGRLSGADTAVALRFTEVVHRLLLIPSMRRLLVAQAVFGILLVPYQTFIAFFLDERWGLDAPQRGIFAACMAAASVVALALFAKRGEALFGRSPASLVRLASGLLGGGVAVIALAALAPWFAAMCALFGLSAAMLAALAPSLQVAIFSVMPAHTRPHAAALMGIAIGVGGITGAVLLGGVDRRFGIGGTIVSLIAPGVLGALLMFRTAALVPHDIDAMIDETIEDEEIAQLRGSGAHLPLLACRSIDFGYDQIQVLFGVDLTVEQGEMVALLGTNGAGKSTLLQAISGIGLPTAGSIRFDGRAITHLDAERRVHLGITQIPGGHAVFGSMSVVENLRSYGYALGRRRAALDDAIDECFDVFPHLAERRDWNAATLSGGGQQMLALSKALVLHPRVLLIDELSLGLAPAVVSQLLQLVKRINATGTSVVLVEQSVNIALDLVSHAYFMEKGQIVFDGPSDDLRGRDDLLRAVFLSADRFQPVDATTSHAETR